MEKRDKTEIILDELFFISSRARQYAEWIKNQTMIDKIVKYTLHLEKYIRGKNEKTK